MPSDFRVDMPNKPILFDAKVFLGCFEIIMCAVRILFVMLVVKQVIYFFLLKLLNSKTLLILLSIRLPCSFFQRGNQCLENFRECNQYYF